MKQILITVITTFVVGIFMLNVPARWWSVSAWLDNISPTVGTAFTTLSSSDTLSNFPSTYNTNITLTPNLTTANSFTTGTQQFPSASSTTFGCYGPCSFGASATSSFSTAGALTLISPLAIASGGTASTSLTLNQVMIGNGSSGFKVIGFGTSGQFFTSAGDGVAPSWTTAAVDQAGTYTWTGPNMWTAASSTFVRGVTFSFSTTTNATSTSYFITNLVATGATTTNLQIASNASTTNLVVSTKCTNCVSGYERVTNTGSGPTTGGAEATVTVDCSAGKKVIGGGAENDTATDVYLKKSRAADDDTWTVTYIASPSGAGANTMEAFAICTDSVQ